MKTETPGDIAADALRLHKTALVIDGLSFLYDGPTERLNPRLVTATNLTAARPSDGLLEALKSINRIRLAVSRDANTSLVLRAADIELAKREQTVGMILGLQNSLCVEADLANVALLHTLGIRIMQLTYNYRVLAGDGCLEPRDGGLSRFGRQLVEEMAHVGVVVDLSHVGPRTSLEAIDASPKPCIFSHVNPSALTVNPRNIGDEQMRKVSKRGGLVGCSPWATLCWKNTPGRIPTVDDYVDHVDYAVNLVGIDHVSMATDSRCTTDMARALETHQEFIREFPEIGAEYDAQVSRSLDDRHCGGMLGIADLTPITAGLLNRGYSTTDTKKIMGENLMRVFREVWAA